MDAPRFYMVSALITFIIVIGCVFLFYNKGNKKRTGKSSLGLILTGWILITLSIIGFVIAFLVFLNYSSGMTGLLLFIVLSPLVILGGTTFLLAYGLASLTKGCKRDNDGHVNKEAIIRGAFLVFLAIALIVTIIVSMSILLEIQSNARGDKPILHM